MRYTRPPGFPDLDPQQYRSHRQVRRRLLDRFETYGYEQVGVPTLEYVDLYEPSRMGAHLFHDLILARLSEADTFPGPAEDPGPERLHTAALRPDFTTPLARQLVEQILRDGVPQGSVRRAYSGPVFRDAQAGQGRLKEFHQVGVEHIGLSSLDGELEILTLACDAALDLSLQDWRLHLGHAGLFRGVIHALELPDEAERGLLNNLVLAARLRISARMDATERFEALLPGRAQALARRVAASGMDTPAHLLAPESRDSAWWREHLAPTFEDWLRQVWVSERGLPAQALDTTLAMSALDPDPKAFFTELQPLLRSQAASDGASELQLLVERFQARRQAPIALTAAASRGIGYYDGLTLELHGPSGALCGGGRYRGLHTWLLDRARQTALLRGGVLPPEPAGAERMLTGVGLAFGVERLVEAMPAQALAPKPTIYAVQAPPDQWAAAAELCDTLRAHGLRACLGGAGSDQPVLRLSRESLAQDRVHLELPGCAPQPLDLATLPNKLER